MEISMTLIQNHDYFKIIYIQGTVKWAALHEVIRYNTKKEK